jgi:hypothetical protein
MGLRGMGVEMALAEGGVGSAGEGKGEVEEARAGGGQSSLLSWGELDLF